MNAKTIYWIIAIGTICIGAGVTYNYYQQEPELSQRELCFAGSIDACVSLDKTNKRLYKELEVTQQQIAENNKAIKEQAGKLLSGSSFQ
jgi:uncharacterized protein HemX